MLASSKAKVWPLPDRVEEEVASSSKGKDDKTADPSPRTTSRHTSPLGSPAVAALDSGAATNRLDVVGGAQGLRTGGALRGVANGLDVANAHEDSSLFLEIHGRLNTKIENRPPILEP